jgi:hypothetical protein
VDVVVMPVGSQVGGSGRMRGGKVRSGKPVSGKTFRLSGL